MENVDILIIGAGVIGLATAARLSGQGYAVAVAEKHTSFGQETSSRNSEVIHAGIYYPADSWKARLCVSGNPLLYAYCQAKGIQHARLGKIIVATQKTELKPLQELWVNGQNNGVPGLELWEAAKVKSLEPEIECLAGLFSPSSGILDTHGLMQALFQEAQQQGAMIAFQTEVVQIEKISSGFKVLVQDGFSFQSKMVINSAGLAADQIAAKVGMDVDQAGYRLHYCKGDYFRAARPFSVQHLIYPVPLPQAVSLGIHLTKDLAGSIRFGPDAQYVDQIDYNVADQKKYLFGESIRRYLPSLSSDELAPDTSGIRPKLQGPQDGFRDFVLCHEIQRGWPGWVNLIGIDSPGLTSCLSIANHVADMVLTYLVP